MRTPRREEEHRTGVLSLTLTNRAGVDDGPGGVVAALE